MGVGPRIGGLAGVRVLSGCAAHVQLRRENALAQYQRYAGPPIEQFHAYRFSSWEVVGDAQVVIWTEFRDAYLLTLWKPCPELGFTNYLAVTTTVGSVSRFEKILIEHHTECMIDEIRRINTDQMRKDRAAEKAQQKSAATAVKPVSL